jgi:glycosyltransferase involved in cell wall biosynthesis
MRIVIDGGTWGNARGYGRFTRELVGALAGLHTHHELVLLMHESALRLGVPPGLRVTLVPTRESPAVAAHADGYRTPRDLWTTSRAIARERPDVIFFPSVYSFVPIVPGPRAMIGIHDVIPELFPALVFPRRRARVFWTLKMWLALRQAARIITVSAHARDGIIERLSVDPEIIRIVPEAPTSTFRRVADTDALAAARRSVGVPDAARLVIYVGGIAPHKNLAMLVDVFTKLVRTPRFADAKLLLIGDYHDRVFYSSYPALRAQVDAGRPDAVIFTGYLPDDVVACLLSGASVCVLPSLEEGFGLPIIEAAACGAPVVATRSSAIPEVLGEAALYIDPGSPDELRHALERVLDDPVMAGMLGQKAAARATELTWESSARRLLDVFEEFES